MAVFNRFYWMNDLLRPAPTRVPDSNTWTDEEIIRAAESALCLADAGERIVLISEDTVVKFCGSWDNTVSEALAMDLAYKQTRIPVPRMRRTIRHHHCEGDGLIVMDLVPNSQQLRVAWPSLSIWGKLRVILTMRIYLYQLRRVRYPPSNNRPGPLGPAPLPCDGLQFGFKTKGPFSTMSALEDYFRNEHHNAEVRGSRNWSPAPNCRPLDTSAFTSLVFTHNDLNMRNLLIDDNHVLWVIDWGFAGFYPPWFEYLGMKFAAEKDRETESWVNCVKYMAEPAFDIEEWMKRIGYDYAYRAAVRLTSDSEAYPTTKTCSIIHDTVVSQ